MYVAFHIFYSFCICLCTYFAYVYRFFVRLCMGFANVVCILCTYRAYLLRKFCGFCIHILIFVYVEQIHVRIQLIFWDDRCGPSWRIHSSGFFDLLLSMWTLVITWKSQGSDLEDSVEYYSWSSCCVVLYSLMYPIFRVPLSSFSAWSTYNYWTLSMIQYLGFRRVLFTHELLVIIGLSQESDCEGSVKFFIKKSDCDSPSHITSDVSCWSW